MARQAAPRRGNRVITIVAVVWFVAALLFLASTLRGRLGVTTPPMPVGPPPAESTAVVPVGQQVVVSLVNLQAGDLITADLVELQPTRALLSLFPDLQDQVADPADPRLSGYAESIDEVEGLYATVDVIADRPLPLSVLAAESPLAHPLDPVRTDRLTIALPDEPTIYPLLQPGDRVDVMAVTQAEALGVLVREARVVAINNIAVEGSGLIGRDEELLKGGRFEAARRKKARLEAQRAREQAAREADGEPIDETAGEEPPPAEEEPATTEDGQPVPEGAVAAGRQFDGRTLTLQVTPREAQLLATVHRTAGVTLEFALHPRR